ncbi:polyphosphate kinase [Pseudooceanicola nanhaiensis]|jgi:ABC-type uncharacterized transport system substrate-binding protein|uniref:Polyphosphate kinase n=1 Tax=Pseudooceanicola nanhaiensis TaxID=375761 RepID=A0A917SR78_9RHOB|nr:DUF1007 family protein [Pseudooceanicola nanhaiensis]GGL92351.1 polyphosphate kinase [Pseudooceanicola nanhaiensis]
MDRLLPALFAILLPLGAQAHPHIFVDTALALVTDAAGRPAGVEVTWRYDEFYSLLIFEDMGLDGDYDGTLTEAELARLTGFDMQWVDGYAGDLYVSAASGPVTLGPPEPRGTAVSGGRIETRHFRPFAEAAPPDLVLRAYDPTYYTAYDLTGGVTAPEGCAAVIEDPDLEAARKRVEEELDGRPPTIDDFPEVGEAFAQTVTIHCGAAQ